MKGFQLRDFSLPFAGAVVFAAIIVGQSASAQTPPAGQEYEYDERGRLRQVTLEDCSTIVFDYDLNGNRTARTVTVGTCGNSTPVWTSGSTASIAENQSGTGYTASASDAENDPLTYTIVGGADAASFVVNASSGALSFVSAPDFEAPSDQGGNNVYDVTLRVADASSSTDQAVAVTVSNLNEVPVWLSGTSVSVAENETATGYVASASDPEGDAKTYSIGGGADAAAFSINGSSGALSFISAPDFEAPTDSGGNNVYNVTLRVSDGSLAADRSVAITVTDVAEQTNQPPVAVNDTDTAPIGSAKFLYVLTNDSDPDGDPLTITNVSLPSQGNAVIQNSGALYWIQYTSYPFASGADSFTYTVSDGNGGTDTATVQLTLDGGCSGFCF